MRKYYAIHKNIEQAWYKMENLYKIATIPKMFARYRDGRLYSWLDDAPKLRTFLCIVTVTTLTVIGGYLRFYNLDWGQPFLHPDEFNIGHAISTLDFPHQLNPQFFAYGSFPLYLTYFLGVVINTFQSTQEVWSVSASQAILIGRYVSAFLSTLLIPLLFVLARQLKLSKPLSLIITALATCMIGFIQYAHFATFETFLTFFYCLAIIIALKALKKPTLTWLIALSVITGLAIATKIVSLYLLALPLIVLLAMQIPQEAKDDSRLWKALLLDTSIAKLLHNPKSWLCLALILLTFVVTNPFTFLDWQSFWGSMQYERGVADGSLAVFYTRGFLDTIPGLYQLQHVLPFISGYVFTAVSILSVLVVTVTALRTKDRTHTPLLILLFVLGGYLIVHLLMYVKWTRYMIPVLPLLLLALGIAVKWTWEKLPLPIIRITLIALITIVMAEISLRGVSFSQIYRVPDTRVSAAQWAQHNIPPDVTILSEQYDPGVMPFNNAVPNMIRLFNLYDYDTHPDGMWSTTKLAQELYRADAIIIPSRRVYKTASKHPDAFPRANQYYQALFDGELGYELAHTSNHTPCVLPADLPDVVRIFSCPINDEHAEETFVVFDHPTVLIYQKTTPLSVEEYLSILERV